MHKVARNYIGLKVKSKDGDGDSVGNVMFSSFGVSVGGITEEGSHWQTLGMDDAEFFENWEVIEEEE